MKKEHKWPIGLRVFIPSVEGQTIKTEAGALKIRQPKPESVGKYGTLTGYDDVKDWGMEIPVFRLDDGTIIKGYECWWEPASENKK